MAYRVLHSTLDVSATIFRALADAPDVRNCSRRSFMAVLGAVPPAGVAPDSTIPIWARTLCAQRFQL